MTNFGKISRPGPHSKKDNQEFGKAKKEFVICMDCGSCYFDKSWHHALDEEKAGHFKKDKLVKFDLCPACKMGKEKRYEGELIIKSQIPSAKSQINPKSQYSKLQTEIKNMIKNSDEQARQRDPMDRMLWTEEKADGLHVYTSENQLAVKIGKKLRSSLGKGKLTIKHSRGEDVMRVYFEV